MRRWLKYSLIVIVLLAIAAVATLLLLMRGSLATLDGKIDLPGLSAPVDVDRDALGVVTIHAANELDAMRALGYVHAQERFFEMDLMRRSASGELAELFGPAAVDLDKKHRVHRFRARVLDHLDAIAGDKLPQLTAYTDGVNAGLADLKVRPWPYLLLGLKPRPWQLSDTPLVGYAMYFELQGGTNQRELALWRIRQHVPPALYALIARDGTSWDAPLEGAPRGDAVLPDAATLDLRKLPMPDAATTKRLSETMAAGSNNFAVSGALTHDGRAIVADDMHLDLRVPNIWFRARLLYPDPKAPGGKVDVGGFTLPGIPAVIVGSNTHVAWAFTNSYGDFMDWLRIHYGKDHSTYTLQSASVDTHLVKPIVSHDETIHVAGSPPEHMIVREVDGDPILVDEPGNASLALQWTAHRVGAINFNLGGLATARNTQEARQIAVNSGVPTQNFVVADQTGHVAWTLIGRLPERVCDGTSPNEIFDAKAWTKIIPSCQWGGWNRPADPEKVPNLVDPPSGRLWTANNRTLDGDALAQLGDSGYDTGARAQQIRDDLFARNRFNEKDLLAIQLDDRAVFLTRWHALLQDTANRTHDPALVELAAAAQHWDGRADPSSVSYRVVRAWRLDVLQRISSGLLAPAEVALGKDFMMPNLPQFEGVAWPLVTQRPANLLPRRFATWDALLADAAHQVQSELGKHGLLATARWGERNTAAICHPFARELPSLFKRWLCMPPDELPGDSNMPRVAAASFGASERMVVSPGHEADGIIEMPGGQSGNPLSPFWGAGHAAWVHGEATPFLPGATTHTLHLLPAR